MAAYSTQLAYLLASALFILSLHWMSAPKTARKSVIAGAGAMAIAIVATWASPAVAKNLSTQMWLLIPIAASIVPGIWLSQVPLTAVPQRTALSHAFGGLAAGLVGTAEFFHGFGAGEPSESFRTIALVVEVILGFLTFSGSIIAAAKLQEVKWIPQRPWIYKGQKLVNAAAFAAALLLAAILVRHSNHAAAPFLFVLIVVLALNFGWMLVMPIGGADMPTVIAILNSYAGLSAVAMGFVLENPLLIVAGALDGASGLILSIVMCKAMNRSFANVLFGAFGHVTAAPGAAGEAKPFRATSAEEAAGFLSAASRIVIVPGYGMAVSQAQHQVRELFDYLTNEGIEVDFAIHPVAGRMPGHMNVLLAEADVPYEHMKEMEEINHTMDQVDVAIVLGANDVVNPAARTDPNSPIAGMPIIDVDKAKTVIVIKRSANTGFAGIQNPLFTNDNTLMYFADGKKAMIDWLAALKAA